MPVQCGFQNLFFELIKVAERDIVLFKIIPDADVMGSKL